MFEFIEYVEEDTYISETLNEDQFDPSLVEIVTDINFIDNSNDIMYERMRTKSPEITTHVNEINNLNKKNLQSSQIIDEVSITQNKKSTTTKKVYEGLQLLTNKQLSVIEGKEKLQDDLNLMLYKKAKLKLESAVMENKIIVLKEETEKKKCDSELRQNKLK